MRLTEFISAVRQGLIEGKIDQQVAKLGQGFLQAQFAKDLARKEAQLAKALHGVKYPERLRDVVYSGLAQQIENLKALVAGQITELTPEIAETKSGYEKLYQYLVEADPSQDKKYLKWIIRWYLAQPQMEIANQDLPKLRDYLDILNRGFVRGFDINRVKTLPDLAAAVQPYLKKAGQPTNRELEHIGPQTNFIYKGPEGTIVSPKTEEAACLWGRNTQWCTARKDDHNQFGYYHRDHDPLYIIILPDGERYQLHLGSSQFMNEEDRAVDPDEFIRQHPWVLEALNLTPEKVEGMIKYDPRTGGYDARGEIGFLVKWMTPENYDEYLSLVIKLNPLMVCSLDDPSRLLAGIALESVRDKLSDISDRTDAAGYGLSLTASSLQDQSFNLLNNLKLIINHLHKKVGIWSTELTHIIAAYLPYVINTVPSDTIDEYAVQVAIAHQPSAIGDLYRVVPGVITKDMIKGAIHKDPMSATHLINDLKYDWWIASYGLECAIGQHVDEDEGEEVERRRLGTIYGIGEILGYKQIRRILQSLISDGKVDQNRLDPVLHDVVFGQDHDADILKQFDGMIRKYSQSPF